MIGEVFAVVTDQLSKTLAALNLGPPFPSYGLGKDALDVQEEYPRIVWVPIGGPVRRARSPGGDGMQSPRALWERAPNIEAHIHAENVEEVEKLANHLFAAMTEVLSNSYEVTNESWDHAGTTDNGHVGIFTFNLKMPFTREPLGSVVATPAITGDIT